jgi:hypothetical protein
VSEADKQDPSSEAYRIGYRQGQAACAYAMKVLEEDVKAARLEGIRLGLEAAAIVAGSRIGYPRDVEMRAAIRLLDPATIAREAVLDKLASDAQEQGMGYE